MTPTQMIDSHRQLKTIFRRRLRYKHDTRVVHKNVQMFLLCAQHNTTVMRNNYFYYFFNGTRTKLRFFLLITAQV
jgi:hypothetical protein